MSRHFMGGRDTEGTLPRGRDDPHFGHFWPDSEVFSRHTNKRCSAASYCRFCLLRFVYLTRESSIQHRHTHTHTSSFAVCHSRVESSKKKKPVFLVDRRPYILQFPGLGFCPAVFVSLKENILSNTQHTLAEMWPHDAA